MNVNAEEINELKEAGYSEEEIKEFISEMKNNLIDTNNQSDVCNCINKCINNLPKELPFVGNINFIKEKDFIKIKYFKDINLKICTPRIFVRFGIDKYYKNWSINFELENKGCDGIKEFRKFLLDFEERILDKLKIEKNDFNSQLKIHDNFNLEFYGRIQSFNGKPQCEIIDKRLNRTQNYINLFSFPKEVFVKAELSTLGIWKTNYMFCYKFTVDKLTIVD